VVWGFAPSYGNGWLHFKKDIKMSTLSTKKFFTRIISLEITTILAFYAMEIPENGILFGIGAVVFACMFGSTFFTKGTLEPQSA
jgi:hypothetical protein